MVTDYEVSAQAWAEKWGVRMGLEFTGHRKYFPDDEDTRDCYQVTLTRGAKSMTFGFGASIQDSRFVPGTSRGRHWTSVQSVRSSRKAPTLYTVVACLEKNDPGTFEQWCSDFGYDTDSRRALETYLTVQKQCAEFRALCGHDPAMLEESYDIN